MPKMSKVKVAPMKNPKFNFDVKKKNVKKTKSNMKPKKK